jgi:MarC family membrane protein
MRVPLTGAAAGRRLIVNADDFGLTLPVTQGIIDAFERGILTSASLVATGTAFDRAAQYAASHHDLDSGVHLMIVHGTPVLPAEKITSLVQPDGMFLPGYGEFMARYLSGGVRDEEVEAEWSAQIARLRGAGVRITHLDSVQHLHLVPGLFRIALRIARANGILAMRFPRVPTVLRRAEKGTVRRSLEFLPLRLMEQSNLPYLNSSGIRTPDRFFGFHSSGHLDQKALRSVLFGGASFLELMGISLQAFHIFGGMLLFLLSLEMVFARESGTRTSSIEAAESKRRADISVFPLAFPFIAGPGALATILLWFGPVHLQANAALFAAYLAAVLIVLAIAFVLMVLSEPLMRVIGVTGANVSSRLLGVILGALAVQFVLDGLRQAFGVG